MGQLEEWPCKVGEFPGVSGNHTHLEEGTGGTVSASSAVFCAKRQGRIFEFTQDYCIIINCIKYRPVVVNVRFCAGTLYLIFLCACNRTLSFLSAEKYLDN